MAVTTEISKISLCLLKIKEGIMKALARINLSDGHPILLLVDFGDNDVSRFKDKAGIIHLKECNGKIVVDEQQNVLEAEA